MELIRGRTTADNANIVVNQVHDINWETKARAYYKFKPGVDDDSLKGTFLILGELVMIGRDDIGFDELMEARTRDEGAWEHDDYKLLMRYTDVNIKSADVATIADQE